MSSRAWVIYKPYGVIAFGVLDTSSISVFCDVGVDIFHQQIGSENAMYEVSTNMTVVEVVLEQRRNLNVKEAT